MNYKNYLSRLCIREENAFEHLHKNLLPTIATFNYLVDWNKVNENKQKYEFLLNNLNYLLGKGDDFKSEFEYLFRENPSIIEALPILLASRDKKIEVLREIENLDIAKYLFKKPNMVNIDIVEHYYEFVIETGLKDLFCNYDIKNLVDYVFGVEVGLNSNARKNRTGATMESIVAKYLKDFCFNNKNFSYIEQATQKRIKEEFNYDIEIDKNNRRFDFALFDKKNNKLFIIEVNFYSGGGSKLKATAGEYKPLNDFIKKQNIEFIWITDGKGWKTALRSLEETFKYNDYVINLNMLKNGILMDIIND